MENSPPAPDFGVDHPSEEGLDGEAWHSAEKAPSRVGSGVDRSYELANSAAGAEDANVTSGAAGRSAGIVEGLSCDEVSVAFRDVWYTVTLKNGEELDLLKGVSGYFKPGTVTALMGSSGAGRFANYICL